MMKKRMLLFVTMMFLLLLPAGYTGATELDTVTSNVEGKAGLEQAVGVEASEQEIAESVDPAGTQISSFQSVNWSSYSSRYYYNMLSAQDKAAWNALNAICYNYLTSDASGTYYSDTQTYYTNFAMFTGNRTKTQLGELAVMFRISNPQYYFLDTGYRYYIGADGTEGLALSFYSSFANGTNRITSTSNFITAINSALTTVKAASTNVQKVKAAHDWIAKKVTYNTYSNYNQSAYGVFNTSSTVCAGYSQAMMLLCNAVGIDAAAITSVTHEWNIVRLNDSWYCVDVTWDDTDNATTPVIYNYFNRSWSMVKAMDSTNQHNTEYYWSSYVPTTPFDSGATYNNIGVVNIPTQTISAPTITASGSTVTIAVPSGARVYYTTNGNSPSVARTASSLYTGPFSSTSPSTVKAVAIRDGYWDSDSSASDTAVQLVTVGDYFSSDGMNYVVTSQNSATLVSYTGSSKYVSIPSAVAYDGAALNVTTIGAKAFYKNKSIRTVSIPDTTKIIASSAFAYCSKLTTVTLGSGVNAIYSKAFYKCSSLKAITIPDSCISIGDSAFYNCTALKYVTFGMGLTTIKGKAFYGCSNISKMTFRCLQVPNIYKKTFLGVTKKVKIYRSYKAIVTKSKLSKQLKKAGLSSYTYK